MDIPASTGRFMSRMWNNKVVVITGGSSGFGLALARRLAGRGARLALLARNQEMLSRARDEVLASRSDESREVMVFSCDVSDPDQCESALARVSDEVGPPEILINSAGILWAAYFEEQPLSRFREEMEVNYFGTLNMIKAALPALKDGGDGRIVNISSVAGVMGVFGYSSYCATKHAINGLTESLRCEFKPLGIKVHLVLPPEADTPMVHRIAEARPPETAALATTIRPMTADAVADAIVRGVERGRFLIVPGGHTAFMVRLGRIFPGLARMIADVTVKRTYRGPGRGGITDAE